MADQPTHRFCPACGATRREGVQHCESCGHRFEDAEAPREQTAPTPPPPPPPPPPATAAPVTVTSGDANRDRRRWIVGLVLLALLVGGGAIFALTKGGDSPSGGGEVILEAAAQPGLDPFTASVAKGSTAVPTAGIPPSTTAPVAAGALQSVPGSTPGLYGGTQNLASCDPEQMIAFLGANPSKARAWAGVIGIDPSQIATYIRSLTPVVLTRDTRVTNHGFVNGAATPRQAVLQAGTAVLVDQYGVPRAKCACGNPLKPPVPTSSTPSYTGTRWRDFRPNNITVVVVNVAVSNYVLVDQNGGRPFVRPAGTSGTEDTTILADQLCALFPDDPSCTTTAPATTTTTPRAATTTTAGPTGGAPRTLLDISSIAAVSNGPTQASVLTLTAPTKIATIVDYHWNNASGATPGTIALRASDGKLYGPWSTAGSPGQGGVPNAYWTATPNEVLPAGSYTVVDSDPGSWAWAPDTAGRGMVKITGS